MGLMVPKAFKRFVFSLILIEVLSFPITSFPQSGLPIIVGVTGLAVRNQIVTVQKESPTARAVVFWAFSGRPAMPGAPALWRLKVNGKNASESATFLQAETGYPGGMMTAKMTQAASYELQIEVCNAMNQCLLSLPYALKSMEN